MKFSKIALAVAALVSAPAFALTPAQISASILPLNQVWITGASAPTNAVFQGVMTLCAGMTYKDALGVTHTNPGTLNVHTYTSGSAALPGAGDNQMAYACEVNTYDARAGDLEGTNVVAYHTVEGGSFNAYAPELIAVGEVNSNLPTFLSRIREVSDLSVAGRCAELAPTNMVITVSGLKNNNTGPGATEEVPVPGAAIARYNGCALTNGSLTRVTLASGVRSTGNPIVAIADDAAPVVSSGGFSDTEYIINKLNLDVGRDIGDIGVPVPTNIGQAFGVAVSYPLYFKLQQNDIASGSLAATCDDAPFIATAPNLTLACQPNMAAAAYTKAANIATQGTVSASLFGGTGVLNFARRAITSGTQSASNIRFLNKPCAAGDAGGGQNPTRAAQTRANFVVTEQSSTGGVKTVLTAASNAGTFGMGVVSMENVPTGTDKYAFVKLDGVSPNSDTLQRANAMAGNYSFWYELEMFLPTSGAGTPGETLLNNVNTALGNPEITNLTGLFLTPLSFATGPNVGKAYRDSKSCAPAVL